MVRSTLSVAVMAAVLLASSRTAVGQNVSTIHVHGPGGPAPAMTECARAFSNRAGANVIVTFGPTARWHEAATRNADMFYSGAENMMTDFVQAFAAQIDVATIEPVYVRAATIMVHPGNPLKIQLFGDLLRPGVRRIGDTATIQPLRRNIVAFEPDTATAHDVWDGPNAPDAWIAPASEHGAHPDESEAIALEPTSSSSVKAFYDFVRSPDGVAIFQRFGWTK